MIKKIFTDKVTAAQRSKGRGSHGISAGSVFQAKGTACEKYLRQKYA